MNIFDTRLVRSLPDIHIGGFGIYRVGWNFRPDWDRNLRQSWCGRWWVWLGPYIIGDIGSWDQ